MPGVISQQSRLERGEASSAPQLLHNSLRPSPSLPDFSGSGAPALDPTNVLLIIPTANRAKTELLLGRLASAKPAHVRLSHCQVRAESGVGEQPYDAAGPRGAFNRAVNAVAALLADGARRAALVEDRRVGTLLVGAIENFVLRRGGGGGGGGPVDHGFVVLCRVSLLDGSWDWVVGVSRGVTVPWEYYSAAQKLGFEDEGDGDGEARRCGRVTIGKLLSANAGVDDADWSQALVGVSRYELLREALEAMEGEGRGGGSNNEGESKTDTGTTLLEDKPFFHAQTQLLRRFDCFRSMPCFRSPLRPALPPRKSLFVHGSRKLGDGVAVDKPDLPEHYSDDGGRYGGPVVQMHS
ncbi:hypothetical protein VTH06DRAFT_4796 [Thermothelomyces fergusii]